MFLVAAAFIVNIEQISYLFLVFFIVDFKQMSVSWGHIQIIETRDKRAECVLRQQLFFLPPSAIKKA